MTTDTTARVPLIRPTMTLAGLIEQYRADPDLPPRRRQELIAALNTIGRALSRPLQDIPAHPAALRAALRDNAVHLGTSSRFPNFLGCCDCSELRPAVELK